MTPRIKSFRSLDIAGRISTDIRSILK